MKSHRVAFADAPVIDGESIVCRNEPPSLVTSRAAHRHRQQSRSRRVESTKHTAATTKSHASSVSRRHRHRRREARLAAPGGRVSARNMRRVGSASNRRRRVVNIELLTATMTSHRVASADAPVIDGESIVCGNELSSLVTYRVAYPAAYRHCQPSPPTSREHKANCTMMKSRTSSLFRRHCHRQREHGPQHRAVEPRLATSGALALPVIAADELRTQSNPPPRRGATRVASADAAAIDSESTTSSNELSSLVTQRAAYRHCQQSLPKSREHKVPHSDDEEPHKQLLQTLPPSMARARFAAPSCRA